MGKDKIKTLIGLHILLFGFSMSEVFSKLASGEEFLSLKFCFYYACIIGIFGIYAICWQQVIKRLPLTVAYANKAITIVWGIVFGMLFFKERLNAGKIIGAVIVIIGVIAYVMADGEEENSEH